MNPISIKILIIFLLLNTLLYAQGEYEGLSEKIPPEVMGFNLSQEPELESVKVNDERNYSLAAYYDRGVEDYFSFRLDAYPDNPEFISSQVKALENAPASYEDDEVSFKTVDVEGYPAQMNHNKETGSFDMTVFVGDKYRQWLLTTTGKGYENEDAAVEAIRIIMKAIM